MSDIWDARIAATIGTEGGYSDDAQDSGGETNWGITIGTARAFGYAGAMKDMRKADAAAIYRARYVVQPFLDLLEPIDSDLAGRLFDGGVNCGVGAAGRWLQRCLNVLNGARAWPDLSTDGVCGASTRYALQAFLAARGPDGRRVLLAMVCALQAAGYITIAEGNPTQRRFEWGWQSTRAFPRTQPEEGRKSC